MNKTLIILCFVLLTSCGPSQEEKKVAAVTCAIMSETRNMDAAVRVREMNEARDKIGGEPFLRGDDAIKEAFEWGLCQELVLNETYDESLQSLKDAKRERERLEWEAGAEDRKIAAEKQRIAAEKQRIAAEKLAEEKKIAAEKQRTADSKPTVKEEFHSNGKLWRRTNYQSKTDGGQRDGPLESYHSNGQLMTKVTYKKGKRNGPAVSYYDNGQLWEKWINKGGKRDGLTELYYKNGQLESIICYDNNEVVDMSRCEKKPITLL